MYIYLYIDSTHIGFIMFSTEEKKNSRRNINRTATKTYKTENDRNTNVYGLSQFGDQEPITEKCVDNSMMQRYIYLYILIYKGIVT